jgi:hypothetical protein
MHDEPDRHQVLAEMIEEGTAAGSVLKRPTHSVLHEAGLVLGGRDFPKLLQSDTIFLRAALGIQAKFPDQLLGERAARTFGKECVLAAERDAGRVAVLVRTVLATPMSPVMTPPMAPFSPTMASGRRCRDRFHAKASACSEPAAQRRRGSPYSSRDCSSTAA